MNFKYNEGNYEVSLFSEDKFKNLTNISSISTKYNSVNEKTPKYRLPAGTYYIQIKEGSGKYWDSATLYADYKVKAIYEPNEENAYCEKEYNDTYDTATDILTNIAYTGNLSSNSDKDYFKISLENKSRIQLRFDQPRGTADKAFKIVLYKAVSDGNGTDKLTSIDTVYSSTNPVSFGKELLQPAGDYYVLVTGSADSMIDYQIQVIQKEVSAVEQITFSNTKNEYSVGDKFQLKAKVLPESAENKALTWKSTDTGIVKVDGNGNVTCLSSGEAYIVATSKDGGNISAEFHVIVKKVSVEKVTLTPSVKTAYIGDVIKFTAKISLSNIADNALTWKSSNKKIATINKSGSVTCLKAGTVTITASVKDGSGISGKYKLVIGKKGSSDKKESATTQLSKIKYSEGSLSEEFSGTKTSYTLTLSDSVTSTKITVTKADKNATVYINDKKKSSITVSLKDKKSKIVKIKVIAKDTKSKTYTIKVVQK